jgi:phage baseplate assembly protein W
MLILTNKGEIFGQPDFGCDLEEYLFETRLSADFIEGEIEEQVRKFIPEVNGINFTLRVNIYEDPERFQEWMEIVFKIADYEVYAAVGV